MALRADSYGNVTSVLAFTKHLLDGQSTFNSTTRPTLTEIEGFIDRRSGVLNIALSGAGFTTPINSTTANSTASLLCDDYVITKAAAYVELTQRSQGFDGETGERSKVFFDIYPDSAVEFVAEYAQALKLNGAGVTVNSSDGLAFTGLDVQSARSDPDNTALEQPKFKRAQWDNEE